MHVVRAVRREYHPPSELERGPLLEGWVATVLKAYGEPGSGVGLQYDGLFYWAPAQGGKEVDFLLQRGREFTGLEVRAKETLSPRDFKGLQTLGEIEAVRRRIVVFLGQRPFQTEDGIEVLPVGEFLSEIEAQRI